MIEYAIKFLIELAFLVFVTDRIIMWRYDRRKSNSEKQ